MKSKKWPVILLTMLYCSILNAQNYDFGIWTSASLSFKILPKLKASVEEEFRLRDKSGSIDRFESTLDLSYKFNKYISASGGYVLINYNHPEKSWETRHRFYLDAQGEYSFCRFKIGLRERFQSTYRIGISRTENRANPKFYLRSRILGSYDIRKSGFSPFGSVELYYTLNDPQENNFNKIRYTIGTKYRIDKKSVLSLYYRYVAGTDYEDIEGVSISGLSYSFTF